MQKNINRQISWNEEEDNLLMKIIIVYCNENSFKIKWNIISNIFNEKSLLKIYRFGKHCRERWNNYLDP